MEHARRNQQKAKIQKRKLQKRSQRLLSGCHNTHLHLRATNRSIILLVVQLGYSEDCQMHCSQPLALSSAVSVLCVLGEAPLDEAARQAALEAHASYYLQYLSALGETGLD
eukprot:4367551-Amphidinium_carterae.1